MPKWNLTTGQPMAEVDLTAGKHLDISQVSSYRCFSNLSQTLRCLGARFILTRS